MMLRYIYSGIANMVIVSKHCRESTIGSWFRYIQYLEFSTARPSSLSTDRFDSLPSFLIDTAFDAADTQRYNETRY
jgi:hypothetical protein